MYTAQGMAQRKHEPMAVTVPRKTCIFLVNNKMNNKIGISQD